MHHLAIDSKLTFPNTIATTTIKAVDNSCLASNFNQDKVIACYPL